MAESIHPIDPIGRFLGSFARARAGETFDPTCAALATVDLAGQPSVRFVLVRSVDERGFCFFTNFRSRKARDLESSPRASLAYHWASIGEQVRVEGRVERLEDGASDAYFAGRPRGSQIGAWASAQSEPLDSDEALRKRVCALEQRFAGQPVPRPEFWGGYRICPTAIEFWLDRPDRLHERYLYLGGESGWELSRLQP